MESPYDKKRLFPRVTAEKTIVALTLDDRDLEVFGIARSISLGGCLFTSPVPIGVGTELGLSSVVETNIARAVAKVVYEIKKGDHEYEVGVEFVEILPECREMFKRIFTHAARVADE